MQHFNAIFFAFMQAFQFFVALFQMIFSYQNSRLFYSFIQDFNKMQIFNYIFTIMC